MGVKLAAASGGSIELVPTNTASAFTVTVPAVTATVLTDSAGILNIGSGQVYKDASGNVGIGTTNPLSRLVVSNGFNKNIEFQPGATSYLFAYDRTASDYLNLNIAGETLTFSTDNGTERARIDSSGNLLVGKTTNNDTTIGCVVTPTDGNTGRYKATGDGGASGASFQVTNTSGTALCLIRPNGNLQNANNSYGAISDIKLKENIIDATPKLAGLMQVKVRNYNLIESDKKQIGVIAQELEQIFPSMVEESPDEDKDGNRLETTTKSVKYSVFVPMLIKAIQEQQALIVQLQADVAALKGAQA